ncbi:MAG: acyl carrier protein [Eubacterium sp.]|nr:acyl carrier protein [Eubacterium sp.]
MTFEKVKELIVETLSVDEAKITMEASLAEDLKIDSLDAVELVMALEEEYDIKLPDDVLKTLVTVSDVVKCVDEYKA